MEPQLVLRNVSKDYQLGGQPTRALNNISFSLDKGSFTCIAGSSGCGKTTLLNVIGGLDHISSGEVILNGKNLQTLSENELSLIRRKDVKYIFQNFNLIATLTSLENIEYPLLKLKLSSREIRDMSLAILSDVGLSKYANHFPHQMSGGQRQRIAIARALNNRPEIVLADEPTANLDRKTTEEIMSLLQNLNEKYQVTLVISTHDPFVMKWSSSIIRLLDGKISEIEK